MERYSRRCRKSITTIAPETMAAICQYPWPENVREMENFIGRSVILSQGPLLDAPVGELRADSIDGPGVMTLEGIEREHIVRALNASSWVVAGRSGAAAKLNLKRTSLQYKMQKLGISRPQ